MSLYNIKTVSTLLSVKKLKPNKSLGQNFLVDKNIVEKIISSISLKNGPAIIEFGPGLGVLTKELENKVKNITVIEIDKNMVEILETQLNKNVKIINQDILKVDLSKLTSNKTSIIGNLPYYITTEIIEKVYEISTDIEEFIIMIQQDVATKILNLKQGKDLSFVSIISNYAFNIDLVVDASKNCFYPIPNVDSTVLKLSSKKINKEDLLGFKDFVIKLMKQRRKTVLNNLKEIYGSNTASQLLIKLDLDSNIRAEKLDMTQIIKLYKLSKDIVIKHED
jgi:16S rRNA (adenine1518-N6/adenine1519-N6)-dimethyltransferase